MKEVVRLRFGAEGLRMILESGIQLRVSYDIYKSSFIRCPRHFHILPADQLMLL